MTFNVLKNKYVLYFLLFISLTNVLGYLTLHDYESLTLMVTIGMLSYYFSKNMIIVLSAAILGAGLLRVPARKEWPWREREGLENKDEESSDAGEELSDTEEELGGTEEQGLKLLENMEKNGMHEGIANVTPKKKGELIKKINAAKAAIKEQQKEEFELNDKLKEKTENVSLQYKNLANLVGNQDPVKQDGAVQVDLEEQMKGLEPLVKSAENMMKMMETSGMLSMVGKMTPIMDKMLSSVGKK
jgi:hypothetical protein